MCDVGEEILAHGREALQGQMVAPLHALDVEESRQHTCQHEQHKGEDGIAGVTHRPLLLQPHPRLVHIPFLLLALDVQARVLDAVHLLHVKNIVLLVDGLLVGGKCRAVVAEPLVALIV